MLKAKDLKALKPGDKLNCEADGGKYTCVCVAHGHAFMVRGDNTKNFKVLCAEDGAVKTVGRGSKLVPIGGLRVGDVTAGHVSRLVLITTPRAVLTGPTTVPCYAVPTDTDAWSWGKPGKGGKAKGSK